MAAVYVTAWLAIASWAGANWLGAARRWGAARLFWSVGALSLLGHWMLAFHLVHAWNHAAAARAIAAETHERTGLDWGGGIYVNHAFTLLWLLDAAWWWLTPQRYLARPAWLHGTVQFLFLFLFFNATVVFGKGLAIPGGLFLCALGVIPWLVKKPAL